MGTPAFMPPEQARGRSEQLDGRTDLWAVGATMFFALSGRAVHEAETHSEELLAATQPAPSLASVAPALPKPLIELVDRALAYEQGDRWPNAMAMQLALREVQAMLIEKHGGASQRDPLVSLEDLTPPISSHSPVTISRASAQGLDTGSIAPRHSKGRHRSGFALGFTVVLAIAGLVWLERRHQQANGNDLPEVVLVTPPAEPAAAPFTAVTEPPASGESAPSRFDARASDPPRPNECEPSVQDIAVHGDRPLRSRPRGTLRSVVGRADDASPLLTRVPQPGPAPQTPSPVSDPLDRRK
jgi:serine/threonine protein kinase